MGSNFETYRLKDMEETKLRTIYNEALQRARIEDGNGGYTGSLAESTGLTIETKTFDTQEKAYNWLEENTEKWGNTIAVRVKNTAVTLWMLGGTYSD